MTLPRSPEPAHLGPRMRFPTWDMDLITKVKTGKDADGEEQDVTTISALPINVTRILALDPHLSGAVSWNECTNQIELCGWLGAMPEHRPRAGNLRDNVVIYDPTMSAHVPLQDYLMEVYGILMRESVLSERIRDWAMQPGQSYHPIRVYLESVRWDGEQRLGRLFLDFWKVADLRHPDVRLWEEYGRRHMIAAVARIMTPGCKADTMLILQGPQGLGKSTGIRALCPDPSWVQDAQIKWRSSDGALALQGRWHVEIAELDDMRRAEQTEVKRYLSQQEDKYRPPYGRSYITRPRQCVFWGTTNDDGFFSDPTGARRFWVVPVVGCDVDKIRRLRDQLWAEAVELHRAGAEWWLYGDLAEAQAAASIQWEEEDPWTSIIETYVQGQGSVDVIDIWASDRCLKSVPGNLRGHNGLRITRILHRLGWTRGGYVRVPGGRRSVRWIAPAP